MGDPYHFSSVPAFFEDVWFYTILNFGPLFSRCFYPKMNVGHFWARPSPLTFHRQILLQRVQDLRTHHCLCRSRKLPVHWMALVDSRDDIPNSASQQMGAADCTPQPSQTPLMVGSLVSGNCRRPMWGMVARHRLWVGRGVHHPSHIESLNVALGSPPH